MLEIGLGSVDFEMYHDLVRSIRLLALAGRKPQEFMSEEADFLFGCPLRYESFTDDEIDAIRFDPNVEAVDNRTFYYVWFIFGEYDEIKMAVKIDSERGTVHPLPFMVIQSDYFDKFADKNHLTGKERKVLIDRIFYTSLIPGEADINIDEEDMEDLWDDEDEEDDDFWDEDEKEYWEEECEDMDEDDIEPEFLKKITKINESMRDIKVLSVTDLHGNDVSGDETSMFPNIYANMKGFVGKNDKIAIGERMYIFHPEPTLNPYCPNVRIHTSTVMFHSEELISENEVKHIVRTMNSIYTFIEYKKHH